jgi:Rrf2 family protein
VRLSTKGRYAVMAMADLAGNEGGTRPVSLAEIAKRQEISLSYLEQLFAKLRKGGLVRSVRGPGGGYRLSRPASELRIADIILAVDEPIATTRCKTGSPLGLHRYHDALRDPRSVGRTRPADSCVSVVRVAGRCDRETGSRPHAALRSEVRSARSRVSGE